MRFVDDDDSPSSETLPSHGSASMSDVGWATPAQIGRFAVLGKLGEGGMGVVFLGRDAELERKIAIKLMRSNAAASIGVRRLMREAQGLARLSHPNVIQVHEIGEYHGSMFVAMEYVEGSTLRDWLDYDERPWQEVLDVLRQSGRGLEAAHDAGLVHRDFKPGNVMVGKDGRARVLDFGLARDCSSIAEATFTLPLDLDQLSVTHDDSGAQLGSDLGSDLGSGLGSSLTRSGAIVGTPAYMAPEQIKGFPGDPLSDQFSFCVTAYEALFGQRPYGGATLAELATNVLLGVLAPIPADTTVPERVQQAVLRGLSPDRDRRWSSMAALLDELDEIVAMEEVRAYLERAREAGEPLALEDRPRPTKLRISSRLYGREDQLEALRAAFERASDGAAPTELLLVTGLAGIGKSSLVAGLEPSVAARGGLMIAGRFGRRRATPLAGIVEALSDLAAQLERLEDRALARLREGLSAAVGRNLRLLGDLSPELGRLLGDAGSLAGPLPELAGPERLNRLHLAVERFIATLARVRPLVLFVDDLQWADPASLALLEHLLSSPSLGPVLVVGACRINEVGPDHPLRGLVERLRGAGVRVTSVELEALSAAATEALLAETIGAEPLAVRELARVALERTEGNPFYLRQLLRTMVDEGLLRHDPEDDAWTWDLGRIAESSAFGDIGEVLLRGLASLPPASVRLVRVAACIGPRVDLLILAAVAEREPLDALSDLWPTFEHGLLLLDGDLLDNCALVDVTVGFRHGRVQQAAADSLSAAEQAEIHRRAGRALQRRHGRHALGAEAFEIAEHLNLARALLDERERSELVALNLVCGRRALESAAFAAAIDHLDIAGELLGAAAPTDHHELWFHIELERGHALSLDGRYAAAERCFEGLLAHARTVAERLRVHAAQVEHALLVTDFEGGYVACRRAFALHGLELPEHDDDAEDMLVAELAALEDNLAGRELASLATLPEFDDDEVRPLLGLLHGLGAISYFSGRRNLYAWNTARMTNIFVRSGNSRMSSVAYARMALHLAERGEYERARAFGELVFALCERYDDPSVNGRALVVFLGHAAYYNLPLLEILPHFEAAFAKCLEGGDLLYAGYNLLFPQYFRLVAGVSLADVLAEIRTHLGFLRRSVPSLLEAFYGPHIVMLTCALMDIPLGELGLRFDHDEHLDKFGRSKFAMGWYYPALTKLEYLIGRRHAPEELVRRVDVSESCLPGNLQILEIRYYAMLSLLDSRGAAALALIEGWRADLARCAGRCPANFRHQHLLVEAELVRATGGPLERAIDLYEQAIDHAQAHGILDQEALACRRFAEFWRGRGSHRTAQVYLRAARELYERWGAARLVRELE